MGKIRVGNKQNSFLNGEWAAHGGKHGKSLAASRRRAQGKEVIAEELSEVKKDERPRRTSRKKKRNVWVIEFRWKDMRAYNSCSDYFKGPYSKDWKSYPFGSKFRKQRDALNSLHSFKNGYLSKHVTLKEWRIKNLKTGEIVLP